ncbi:MAG TPA: malectin domain-containing carbohydrate-binding protein [Candidatus Acidoferrales bacterium]|jgi:hypothetical protein|nr:malectin domain-containing carbohydrate-binding protein [Candidatus Acidoferrales bacterium]
MNVSHRTMLRGENIIVALGLLLVSLSAAAQTRQFTIKNNCSETVWVAGAGNPTPVFTAGSSHTVRLHFAETYFSTAGSRKFNVAINGKQVLSAFDIFVAAGAKNKAIVRQFTANANASGQYIVQFTSVVNQSLLSAIEVQ